jgi:hypothetical protein
VIVGHLARHAYAQDFFQAMFASQPAMGIAGMARRHGKTLLPFRNKMHLQEVVSRWNAVRSCQAHFFHQAILQGFEQSLDASFGLRTVRGNPFDS